MILNARHRCGHGVWETGRENVLGFREGCPEGQVGCLAQGPGEPSEEGEKSYGMSRNLGRLLGV
jgi:hypothetical protein